MPLLPTNAKPQSTSWYSSKLFIAICSIFVLGYLFILSSLIFGNNSISDGKAHEIKELLMKTEMLQKSVIQKEKELERFRSKLSKNKEVPAVQAQQITTTYSDKSKSTERNVITSDPHSLRNHGTRPGVIILGMHRSGTSVLGGLINKMGLKTGGPLIEAAEDNAKGFFERIDVVLQNDYIMQKQQVHYSHNTYKFDANLALKHVLSEPEGSKFFNEGKRGLAFLNNQSNYLWMLKDPRLCITVRFWLPLLNFVPAIIFTYRHPLDVALSMNKREFEHFQINKGLRMWYVYNRRAIQQSDDLCRVVTSHRKVMQQSKLELSRIYQELKDCGVAVPHDLDEEEISSFIDIKLQHGRTTLKDTTCDDVRDNKTIKPPETWPTNDPNHLILYREVMRVYCAMESGDAFKPGFSWDMSIMDN